MSGRVESVENTGTNTGIGQPVQRKEDQRLLTGAGCYTDDVSLPGQAYAVFVRSPYAHARIRSIDVRPALALPGIIAVLTGQDLLADGVQPLKHRPAAIGPANPTATPRDGMPAFTAPQHVLTIDKARHVGELIAIVIAESVALAKDGAERVDVDYEELPSVTATRAAAEKDAPRVWEEAKSNICLDGELGDEQATEAAFARAAHVVTLDTWVQRVAGVTMEPRAAVAAYDPATQRYTLHAGSGGAVRVKRDLATALGVPADRVRVVMQDVGGNFGTRGTIYPEFIVVPWAAKRIGRPVKWTCERHESFASDFQGRDLASHSELALDKDGNFLAVRGTNIGNAGAHAASFAPVMRGVAITSNLYRVPAAYYHVFPVVSNTAPTRAYRSSGRPEVMFIIERLIDIAARECHFDRVELRRRNLIKRDELPYTNPFGLTYDSGDYPAVMEEALVLGDWAGFPARREEARRRGMLRGIGMGNYVDTSIGEPRERAEITVYASGKVDVVLGVPSQGQGGETSFAQLVCEWLGVPLGSIRLITGDTDLVSVGGGAHGGRGMRMGSLVIWNASNAIIEKGKRVAACMLECDPRAVRFEDGAFVTGGNKRAVGMFEVAAAVMERDDLPDDLRGKPLGAISDERHTVPSFPYGTHVCEVEIDPETGVVKIVRYVAVDDVGRAINPLLIDGQIHGGIVQGAGQALCEHVYYDPETGQLLSGTLMDYAMPRADIAPFFTTALSEIPATTHPLGIRPAGESGITPALATIINSVVDALAEFGVRHMDMPATSQRIWQAIHARDAQ